MLVVQIDVEEQHVTGPRLGNHAQLFIRGDLKIERGTNLRVEFDGGNDIGCWPCGLNVTRIAFTDGAIYDVVAPDIGVQDNFERGHPTWWEETLIDLVVIVAVMLVAAGVVYGIIRFARLQ